MKIRNLISILFSAAMLLTLSARSATPTNPIMFVTQVPVPADFTTIASVFGNHLPDPNSAIRGGDLWIRYPDGTTKNLTAAAGLGSTGATQDAKSIAVREPSIHWSGTKALFSMVIGCPTKQFDYTYVGFWQIYEITGFGQGQTPVITKVANQPANFNNISPIYGTDERVIFTSDRTRNGALHLYPQRDEYEFAPTVSGLFSFDPVTGNLVLLSHDPSGSFTPTIDSYGRVIFTRWDHLQRDQEADEDASVAPATVFGTFNYSDETANAQHLPRLEELFPEPRGSRTDLLKGTNLVGHTFNQFFPWMINEDGTGEETMNHVGRHELFDYMSLSLNDDSNLQYFAPSANRVNKSRLDNFLQIREDPTHPGVYYGIDCPEFSTHAAGQIVTLLGTAGMDADNMVVTYVTPRSTQGFTLDGAQPDPTHTGHYRNPLMMTDGTFLAVHAADTRADKNDGTTIAPTTRYDFRIKTMAAAGQFFTAGSALMPAFTKTISFWTPDVLVNYTGNLWELYPVEVVARQKPVKPADPILAPEQAIFTQESVDINALKGFMTSNNLALIISRNLTTRDKADKQQPYNLRITGTTVQDTPVSGKIYDISHLQLFQADQLRGYTGGGSTPRPGRRVLATPMHDTGSQNPADPSGPPGSVALGADGSMAAFVPANRAMTWQTTAPDGTPVVRERYWLSFQPGEIRTCTSCHGVNTADQSNNPPPTNSPEALRTLMKYWKSGVANNPAPIISSAPNANPNPAQAGLSVTFSAAATGTGTISYTWSFGDGTPTKSGASVSHIFAAAGVYSVTVVVSDGGGKSTNASMQVTISAATGGGNGGPTISSGPGATPNPAQIGQLVALSANATGGTGALTYSWDCGDSTAPLTGASISHTYATAGAFNATVTVTDAAAKTTNASVQVIVNTTGSSNPLTVQKAQVHFNFQNANDDTFTLIGSVLLPATLNPAGQSGTITIGSFSTSTTLNGARNNNALIQLRRTGSKKATGNVLWNVTVSLKNQALYAPLSALGFTNGTLVPAVQVSMPIKLNVNATDFQSTIMLSYNSKKDKTGVGTKK